MAEFHEHVTERPKVLHSKYQIGSTTAPLNYSKTQNVFHVNDTPVEKRQAKAEVQSSLTSKILCHEKPRWNVQTSTDESRSKQRTYVNSTLNRSNMFVYNYRAEKLPSSYPLLKPKANKFNTGILEVKLMNVDPGETYNCERIARGISRQMEELPNHPSLSGKTRWNISSDIKAKIHHETFIKNEKQRVENSKKRGNTLTKYKNPQAAYTANLEKARHEKEAKRALENPELYRAPLDSGLFDRLEAEMHKES